MTVFPLEIPLKHAFRIATGETNKIRNYFVRLNDAFFGETSRSIYYGPSEAQIVEDFEKARENFAFGEKVDTSLLYELNSFPINNSTKTALIGATLHKISAATGQFPWKILDLGEPPDMRTSFTISIDSPEKMLGEIKQSPYPILKIKLGFEEDEALLLGLRDIPNKIFRVDANGAWEPERAERNIHLLEKLGAELIEQPTHPDYIKDWRYLKGRSKVPLIMDEGLNTLEDYFKYADYIDGINIKMAKSGGIIEGEKLARQAAKDHRSIMLGCMLETSIGISQAVYLSSLAQYYDLDAPLLLERDVAVELKYDRERISVDAGIIGGPRISPEFIHV